MNIIISETVPEMGRRAAADAAARLRAAIRDRGEANLIVATGASQFEVLAALVAPPPPDRSPATNLSSPSPLAGEGRGEGVDWSLVTGFHLDEYLGLPISHPASFRRYLKERLVDRAPFRAFHYIDGEADPAAECRRVGDLLRAHPIDVALVGIGENAHLAFNDPPADFATEEPYIVVALDDACRRQQFGEGWFPTFEAVPTRAISMSIRQIMQSRAIICSVPDRRKAAAVHAALEGPVTPEVPASILQTHPDATIYLDRAAAELMTNVK